MDLEIFGDSFLSLPLSRVNIHDPLNYYPITWLWNYSLSFREFWLLNTLLKNCQTLVWPAQDKEAIVSKTGFAYVFEHSLTRLHFSLILGVKLNLWSTEGSGNSSNENCSILYSINLHAVIYIDLVKFILWFLADVAFLWSTLHSLSLGNIWKPAGVFYRLHLIVENIKQNRTGDRILEFSCWKFF